MDGHGIERAGYFIPVGCSDYMIDAIRKDINTHNEISAYFHVWPEAKGSTIEFYCATQMN